MWLYPANQDTSCKLIFKLLFLDKYLQKAALMKN